MKNITFLFFYFISVSLSAQTISHNSNDSIKYHFVTNFDFEMAPRYGVTYNSDYYRNSDINPLINNSLGYVQNCIDCISNDGKVKFKVKLSFDSHLSAFIDPSEREGIHVVDRIKPINDLSNLGRITPIIQDTNINNMKFYIKNTLNNRKKKKKKNNVPQFAEVKVTASPNIQNFHQINYPLTSKIKITNTNSGKVVYIDSINTLANAYTRIIDLSMEEGFYKYEVITNYNLDNIHATDTTQGVFEINDILIVCLGDSYSSGEGCPEFISRSLITASMNITSTDGLLFTKLYNNCFWANDGTVEYASLIPSELSEYDNINMTNDLIDIKNTESISNNYKLNNCHHRSTLCYSSLLALKMEIEDKHTSVTYINLAQSGAEIHDGILEPKQESVGERFNYSDLNKQSQIDELRNITRNREIDILTLTAGGNDIGFKQLVTGLIIHDKDVPYPFPELPLSVLRNAINTGDWSAARKLIIEGATVGGDEIGSKLKEWKENCIGLDGMEDAYLNLLHQLKSLNIKDLYFLEYPNLVGNYDNSKHDSAECLNGRVFPYCNKGLEVGHNAPNELRIARTTVESLNNKIATSINAMQTEESTIHWHYVNDIYNTTTDHPLWESPVYYIDQFYNNNINSLKFSAYNMLNSAENFEQNKRWFNDYKESTALDYGCDNKVNRGNPSSFIAHPNYLGHVAIFEILYNKTQKE